MSMPYVADLGLENASELLDSDFHAIGAYHYSGEHVEPGEPEEAEVHDYQDISSYVMAASEDSTQKPIVGWAGLWGQLREHGDVEAEEAAAEGGGGGLGKSGLSGVYLDRLVWIVAEWCM
jgi:hypothetical protein